MAGAALTVAGRLRVFRRSRRIKLMGENPMSTEQVSNAWKYLLALAVLAALMAFYLIVFA
jgi:hypothetical protein